jgi:N-acetylglucosamine-6-phosphate deacetylase
MQLIAGGDLVLPDGVRPSFALAIDRGVIVSIGGDAPEPAATATATVDASGLYVAPGFIDVHVHGVAGDDTLDPGAPIGRIARALTRFGVTGFCPTTVACPPDALRRVLQQVEDARHAPDPLAARVLPAHLESNFINPDWCGAQPAECLCLPVRTAAAGAGFAAGAVLDVMREWRQAIAIVTLAPEVPRGLDLVAALTAAGHRVSLGHSGATYDEAQAAFDAGARHATHLFNQMSPMTHRDPGLTGAALARPDVLTELICDGVHVHPAAARVAIAAKGAARVLAITDGTALSGLPAGASARLGGRAIVADGRSARLEDGTLAGSTLTMDGALRTIVNAFGCDLTEAVRMCATTPAQALGLDDCGEIAVGRRADLVLLDRELRVRATFVGGQAVGIERQG